VGVVGEKQEGQQQQQGVRGAPVLLYEEKWGLHFAVGCSSSSSSSSKALLSVECMQFCRGTPTLVLTVLHNIWQQLQATLMQGLLRCCCARITPVAYPVSSFVTHSPLRHSSN